MSADHLTTAKPQTSVAKLNGSSEIKQLHLAKLQTAKALKNIGTFLVANT